MTTDATATTVLTPQQLHKLSQEMAIAEARKAEADARKAEEHKEAVKKAFMERELRPDAMPYLMSAVKHAAEQGKHEFSVMQFAAELLSDGGRQVNNFDPNWTETLQGYPKRAYEFFVQYLKPTGYRLRAQILDYPNGNLGDVGIFLCW